MFMLKVSVNARADVSLGGFRALMADESSGSKLAGTRGSGLR